MTPMFWRTHPTKKVTATLLFFAALAAIILFHRPITIKGIEYFTKPYDVSISCLDFSFNWKLNLKLNQACITYPLGTMEVQDVIWQPWANVLNIGQVKVNHLEQLSAGSKTNRVSASEQQKNKLNLPTSLPKIRISNLEINSFELLHPLYLSVNAISSNELNITGDVSASITILPHKLVGNITWSISDLSKWIPQAQALSQGKSELLKELAFDESPINTHLIFDGTVLKTNNSLDIVNRFHVSSCPIDAVIKGNALIDVNVNSLDISLDLTQISNVISVINCPLLQDYFTADEMPRLALTFPQKIAINKTHLNLPKLQIVDMRNTHQSVVLNDVNYKTTGELEVSYNISLKQPIETKKIAAKTFNLQSQGTLSANISPHPSDMPISFKIINGNNRLAVKDLKMGSLLIGNLSSEFSFHDPQTKQFAIKGTINSSAIQMGDINWEETSTDFFLSGESFNDLQLSMNNPFFKLVHPEVKVKKMLPHINLNLKELDILSFYGNSTITGSSIQNINFLPIEIAHKGQTNLVNMSLSSQHEIALENGFLIGLTQQQSEVKIQVNQQDIIGLQRIISQLENTLKVEEGNFSVNVGLTLPQESKQFVATGKINFQGLSVKYQNYVLKNINYHTPLTFDSAGFQLAGSTLHVDSIDAGVMIQQLDANVITQNNIFRLKQVQGEIFNGRFLVSDLWLDDREQQFNIKFQNIDLAKVVALQQQPGIKITGNIDGNMPFIAGKQGLRIDNGEVSSLTGGTLNIINNSSFDAIKNQQPELALLENFDFTQLKSSVKFTPDGWVFFDLALQGNNPDKKQNVNFNYSHQENIFSLLESIRLVKSLENTIEQKITQGDKK